jgi:hypothetical protein
VGRGLCTHDFLLLLVRAIAQVEVKTLLNPRSHINRTDKNQILQHDIRNLVTTISKCSNDVNHQGKQTPNEHEDSTLLSRNCLVCPTSTRSDYRVGKQKYKVINGKTRWNFDRHRKFKEFPDNEHHLGDHPSEAQPVQVVPDSFVHLMLIVPVSHFTHLPFGCASVPLLKTGLYWWGDGI